MLYQQRKQLTALQVLVSKCYVDSWMLLAVKSLYSYSDVCVHVGRVKSQLFTVDVGLWQECVLSPLLFIAQMHDPATRSEDCLTTTSLSRLFAERQCWALTGGTSWFPSALRSPERALAAGKTCDLLLRFPLVVVVTHWFGFCCRILYGFNAVLLYNGRFWDGFTSTTSASLWPVTSRDHP